MQIKLSHLILYENLMIQNNIIGASIKYKCKKLIFLGSSCIYPKKNPFSESDLNMSNLEKTNEPYAIAKISGLKLCETYNRQYNKDLQVNYYHTTKFIWTK